MGDEVKLYIGQGAIEKRSSLRNILGVRTDFSHLSLYLSSKR